MISFVYHKEFKKEYGRLPQKIRMLFIEKITLFSRDPNDHALRDHPVRGSLKGKRSFSVTGDVRVIYRYVDSKTVLLLRIGTHNQLY